MGHKLNPFSQTWHSSLHLSTNYSSPEKSSATVIGALISAESHLSRQATAAYREGERGVQLCGIIFRQSINQKSPEKHYELKITILLLFSLNRWHILNLILSGTHWKTNCLASFFVAQESERLCILYPQIQQLMRHKPTKSVTLRFTLRNTLNAHTV